MADYVFEVPLTNDGRDATDPDVIDLMITKGVSMIPRVTYNNLSVESVRVDKETKKIYYGVVASPAMKLGLASFNVEERLAWYDILIAGVAIAGAVVCVILGVVPAAVGLAVVAGIALARESISGLVEAEVNKSKAELEIAEAVADGRITPEEGGEFLDSVDEGWGSEITEVLKWVVIIIGGAIALQLIVPMITKIGKKPET